ncbi:hypothetical protein GCM10020331_090980 [Ectobacillus funiculus]
MPDIIPKLKRICIKSGTRNIQILFMRKYSMHVEKKLDIEKNEKKRVGFFIGEHDFTAFSNAKSKKKSLWFVKYILLI